MLDLLQFPTVKIETLTYKLNDPSTSFPPKIKQKRSIAFIDDATMVMVAMKLMITKLFSLLILLSKGDTGFSVLISY